MPVRAPSVVWRRWARRSIRRRTPRSPFPSATLNVWCGTRRMRPLSPPIKAQTPRHARRPNFPDDSRDRRGPPQAIDAVEWPERKPGVRNAPMLRCHARRGVSIVAVQAALLASSSGAFAQSGSAVLPPITVEAPQQKRAPAVRPPRNSARSARVTRSPRTPPSPQQVAGEQSAGAAGALTVLTAQQALAEIDQTPGGVALVSAEAYRNSTPSNTIKDVLDYVPGVYVQPKCGDDTRLSIRGSGLSRNFHLRGVQLYMDGIPINTADGYGDFQEIDPSAYKYVEVFKGGNALQFGANSLGGAINFVTPTGRDSFPNGVSFDVGGHTIRKRDTAG